jgi:hypothetical protein
MCIRILDFYKETNIGTSMDINIYIYKIVQYFLCYFCKHKLCSSYWVIIKKATPHLTPVRFGWVVSTLLHNLQVWVQILAQGLAVLTEVFCGFPQCLHANARIVPWIRLWPVPSTPFPFHFSLSFPHLLYKLSYWELAKWIVNNIGTSQTLTLRAYLCIPRDVLQWNLEVNTWYSHFENSLWLKLHLYRQTKARHLHSQ